MSTFNMAEKWSSHPKKVVPELLNEMLPKNQ
jgi:hypothetical protein